MCMTKTFVFIFIENYGKSINENAISQSERNSKFDP